jgi:hypothetical protein
LYFLTNYPLDFCWHSTRSAYQRRSVQKASLSSLNAANHDALHIRTMTGLICLLYRVSASHFLRDCRAPQMSVPPCKLRVGAAKCTRRARDRGCASSQTRRPVCLRAHHIMTSCRGTKNYGRSPNRQDYEHRQKALTVSTSYLVSYHEWEVAMYHGPSPPYRRQ